MPNIHNLQDALAWSHRAVQYTRQHIPISPNQSGFQNVQQRNAFHDVRSTVRIASKFGGTPMSRELGQARAARKAGIGNCDEVSSVAAEFLIDNGVAPFVKKSFPIGNGDHCFLLVGKSMNGDWLAICDPWARSWGPFANRRVWGRDIWGDDLPDTDGLETRLYVPVPNAGPDLVVRFGFQLDDDEGDDGGVRRMELGNN